jgi:hypothetical protein
MISCGLYWPECGRRSMAIACSWRFLITQEIQRARVLRHRRAHTDRMSSQPEPADGRNRAQFQKGLSLPEFIAAYSSEEQCAEPLFRWRWPRRFVCPGCRPCQGLNQDPDARSAAA